MEIWENIWNFAPAIATTLAAGIAAFWGITQRIVLNREKAKNQELRAKLERENLHLRAKIEKEKSKLSAGLVAEKNERHFQHEQAREQAKFQQLQDAGQADSYLELIHNKDEFIQEAVYARLKAIDDKLRTLGSTSARNGDAIALVGRDTQEIRDFEKDLSEELKKVFTFLFKKLKL